MEACISLVLLAVHDSRQLVRFDSKSFELGLRDDWAVNDRYGFRQLLLIPKLVMKIHRAQENIELGVCMDPSDSDNAVVYLSLEKPHLVCHVAVVGGALLPRNHQRVNDESIVFLDTAKNSAELKFVFCVQPCNLKKVLDYLNRANYCFELSFL